MYTKISKHFMHLKKAALKLNNNCFKKGLTFSTARSTKNDSNVAIRHKYTVGSEIFGFKIKEVEEIAELQLTAIRLSHVRTGADYLHIARDDTNNVFCIGFRTTPMDSTGVAHILEHNVLCGSKKFPCRDPFFKMLNRSLSTFMNAMTGSDYTVYPFSTQNKIDYRNLMSVYLDAVFKPKLLELDFMQEGWRLEHEDVADKNSPIVFKGVVFNEMKGVFSDSQQLFVENLQNGILPSHTYGYVSGGDPLYIPQLSWEKLKAFHSNHYHPSNSRIYSYGDLPLEDHLSFIDKEYLSTFEKLKPHTAVPDEPRWTEPRVAHIGCNVDPMTSQNNQTSLAVSYMLTSITDDFENFVLYIIGELLVSGPNAPFYKSLIESSLGTTLTPAAGFNNHTKSTTFTIGLQGMSDSKVNEAIEAIEDTFDSVIRVGFPMERIKSVLHNIELSLKHQTSSFGLGLGLNMTPLWNHDGDLLRALKINSKIERFRAILRANPKYLQDKMHHYFEMNNHKYTLTMSPENQFEEKLIEAEKELLEKKLVSLSGEEREALWNKGQALKSKQELKEDISCLPTLQISDISRDVPDTPLSKFKICGNIPFQLCIQPTNGVTYFNAVLSTNNLPKDLLGLVPLFCEILTSMGAGDLNFRELDQKIELVSGGLGSEFHITNHPENSCTYEEGIYLSSYCLQKNLPLMFDLWTNILNELRLDDIERFTTLVKMIAMEKSNGLVHNGHSYAMTAASSSMNYISHVQEQMAGLTYLQNLKELSDLSDLTEILNKLKQIAEHLLNKNNLRVAINTSQENADVDISLTESFIQNLQGENSNDESMLTIPSSFTPCTRRTHHVFSFPVNYSAKAYSNIPYAHPDSGPLRVLARLMFQFLHREIREKGGAYGGGALSSPGGPFSFYSYRDPHSTQTLKTFDEAVNWVLAGDFSQQDVDEAKLGVFQAVDAPVSPGAKGMRQFLKHVTDDLFRCHRLSILNTTSDDLIRACRSHLKEASLEGACLIGPQNNDIDQDPVWSKVVHY